MTSPGRAAPSISDEQIAAIANTVEFHDHQRSAPPPRVWKFIAAQLSSGGEDHDG